MRRLDTWNSDPAGELVTAATGAGKFASDASIRICTYMGSQIWVSVKPELADFGLGRNVDTSPAFLSEVRQAGLEPGVIPTGISSVRYQKPRFRSLLFDAFSESVYGKSGMGSRYNPLADIPAGNPDVGPSRTKALCRALIDSKENSSTDNFFMYAPMATLYAGIGHIMTKCESQLHSLPIVVDFLMGKDYKTGGASPEQFQKNLTAMMNNPAWGGTIAGAASRLKQSGEKTFGSVNYEIGNNLDWMQTESMRRHLSGPSQFSYEDLGNDKFPLVIWIVPSPDDIESARRYMRMHVAMMIAVRKRTPKKKLPKVPIAACFDEARQYIGPESAEASMVLRSAKVKQIQYWQTAGSAKATLGDSAFKEFVSQSTLRMYGVREIEDAEWVSRVLGTRTDRDGSYYPLADPQTVMRELSIPSNLQYVLPYGSHAVMRLERRGFKSIRTREGLRLRGLPLEGHYDEDPQPKER